MATNARKEFPVFDCDSHVVEPPSIWDEYVPAKSRAWVKTQFCFHTDSDLLFINGRVVPAARERSNAAEVGWARWDKKEVGKLTPGTDAWQGKFGRLLGCRDPEARLRDMDALGTDQVMLFPTWFVRLALVKSAEAATVLAQAYNNWVLDYCAADRTRLFPCAVLPLQSVEASIAELRRVAKLGFKAAAVRPCFWNGRYPTLPEFDPLWREFEATGVVLAMHTFPSREALTPEWGQRMAQARGHSGQGLLFTDESVVYSPGQFVSNITAAMDPAIDASETLGFLMEAMTWVTVVVQTGWLEKFPTLKAAVLESNASWLPLVLARCSNFSNLFAFQRDNRLDSRSGRRVQRALLHRLRVGRDAGLPPVGRVPGRRDLVLGLPASRRRGRVGRPAPHGRIRRAGRGAAEADGRERAPALRHRAGADGARADRDVRARDLAVVARGPMGRPRRMLKKAHLLRWRPRPHAQRTESTPRVRPSGAASHLDLFEHPASFSASW